MPILSSVKVVGARAVSLVTGRVPNSGTFPTVWGGSKRFRPGRWSERDSDFERQPFDYKDAVAFLAGQKRGSTRDIVDGSIPEADLAFIAGQLDSLRTGKPLRGLHIGNFVGLSLAYLTDAMTRHHPKSVLTSIDPNIPHRGIDMPQDLVTGLMTRYGLEQNWLPVTGYTMARTPTAGILNRRSRTTSHFSYYGFGASQVLGNLKTLGLRFDFALIDGNHNAGYLRGEIDVLRHLVRPGGLLFLDDVDENWDGVSEVFEGLDGDVFPKVAHEGRIGVVRRAAERAG